MDEEFSKRFRKALGESGMKQKELALQLNMPVQTINSYATGRAKPPEEKLAEICHALNIKKEELDPQKSNVKEYVQTSVIAGAAALIGAPVSLIVGAAAVAGFLSGMKAQKVPADEMLRKNFRSALELIQKGDDYFLTILDRILPSSGSEDLLQQLPQLCQKSGVSEMTITYYAGVIRGVIGNQSEEDEQLYELLLRLLIFFASLSPTEQEAELKRFEAMLPRS